jgi:hypothetical protein
MRSVVVRSVVVHDTMVAADVADVTAAAVV